MPKLIGFGTPIICLVVPLVSASHENPSSLSSYNNAKPKKRKHHDLNKLPVPVHEFGGGTDFLMAQSLSILESVWGDKGVFPEQEMYMPRVALLQSWLRPSGSTSVMGALCLHYVSLF